MNLNKRKILLNIINSKKDKAIVPEVVVKVDAKVEISDPPREEVQLGLKDLEVGQANIETEVVPSEPVKFKKNKKTFDTEE